MVTKLERENNTIFYLHNAWANSPYGTAGFTLEESEDAAYIGNCISMSSAEVLNPSSYNWIAVEFEAVEESDTAELTELGEDVPEDPEDEDDGYSYEDYMDSAVQSAAGTATTAQESADIAQQKAEEATASAALAQQKAEEATTFAAEAKTAADTAREKAEAATADSATAKQKAEEATSSAALAQQKAESATTAAGAAHSAAESATSDARTAGIAAATAQAAAEAAQGDIDDQKKYFYHDSIGAHVLDAAGGAYRTDIKSDGVHIVQIETETPIAKYGETSTIGSTAGNHVTIADDGVRMDSGTSRIANFEIVKAGTKMTHIWTKELDSDRWDNLPALGYGLYYEDVFYPDYAPGTVTSLQFETTGGAKIEIPADSSSSAFYRIDEYGGIHIVGREERPTEEFQTYDWEDVWSLTVEYTMKNNTPILTIGEKIPGKILAVSSDFENILNLDSFGNLTVANSIVSNYGGVDCARGVVNCKSLTAEDDQRNRVSFSEITSGEARITATTGTVTMAPKWWRCGNLVQMEFGVAAVANVAPGKNLAAGTIDGIPRPVTTTGLRAVSYYGDNANVSYVSQDGAFTVRNCGSDTLKKDNNAIGIFTYITDGTFTGGSSTGGQLGGGAGLAVREEEKGCD